MPEDIVNAHDEKLDQKLEANGKDEILVDGVADYNDTDVLISKTNQPPGRQQAVGNW